MNKPQSIPSPAGGSVLVVDDEPAIRRMFRRALSKAGYDVTEAADGSAAQAAILAHHFDAIVSDISMPCMDGIQLLKTVRQIDLDVPVILVTGAPTLDSAIRAVEYGALRYLTKPIELTDLVDVVKQACQLARLARIKREAFALLHPSSARASDRAGLEASLDQALEKMWLACQPVVHWTSRSIFSYEALLRSPEPALPTPMAMIEAAQRLGRLHELGRRVRDCSAVLTETLPEPLLLFVNVHPDDLSDDHLYYSQSALSLVASRVVLEITERARLDEFKDVRDRVAMLRRLGFRIAVDDLGAGYAGLSSFAQLDPEVVKIDMSLVRDVHQNETKSRLIRSLVAVCREMNVHLVAEGVETTEERKTLTDIGCILLQGYLFARPDRPYVIPKPDSLVA